jgi:hypothetical protein
LRHPFEYQDFVASAVNFFMFSWCFTCKGLFDTPIFAPLSKGSMAEQPADADVAQLVERNLAKVEVAGSNLVIRSKKGHFSSEEWPFVILAPSDDLGLRQTPGSPGKVSVVVLAFPKKITL